MLDPTPTPDHFTDLKFCKVQGPLFVLGNRFLRRYKQSQAGRMDSLYLAKTNAQAGNRITAAVWLENQPKYLWLRSLFVIPDARQQGIAKRLVKECYEELSTKPSYCLPWAELEGFYRTLQFETIDTDELPDALAQKLHRYQTAGKNIIAMRFRPALKAVSS